MNYKLTFALLGLCLFIMMGSAGAYSCGISSYNGISIAGCQSINLTVGSNNQQIAYTTPTNVLVGNWLVYDTGTSVAIHAWAQNATTLIFTLPGADNDAAGYNGLRIEYAYTGNNFFVSGNGYSGTYGIAHDNGASVFPFYNNLTSSTGWWNQGTTTATFNANGLALTTTGWGGTAINSVMTSNADILETYATRGTASQLILGTCPGGMVFTMQSEFLITESGACGSGQSYTGVYSGGGTAPAAGVFTVFGGLANAVTQTVFDIRTQVLTQNSIQPASANVALESYGGLSYFKWVLERSSGAQPTVSYGAYTASGGGGGNTISLTIASNPVNYGATDLLTASGNTVNSITLGYCAGSGVCGVPTIYATGTGSASNTICDTTPSISNCWGAGTWNVVANDVSGHAVNSIVLTINGAPVTNTLTTCADQAYTASYSCTTSAAISTLGNQVTATLTRGAATIGTSATSISDTVSNSIGNFAYTWAASSTANYLAFSNAASYNAYVPVSLLNITPGTSALSTKTLTPTISPFTWNGYYPIKLSTASPDGTVLFTMTSAPTLPGLPSGAGNINYIPSANTATNTYTFTITETQGANSIAMVAAAHLNMKDILTSPTCSGLLRYFPNTCNVPSFGVSPTSWTIMSDVAANQHANTSSPNMDTWSNANLTFTPTYLLTYSGFPQFTANAINNPQNAITQTAGCGGTSSFQGNTLTPPAPCTRKLLNVSTYDQRTFGTLSTSTTTLLTALFNNYSIANQTALTGNAFSLYMPTSALGNPQISITSLTLSSSSAGHFLALNNYCPIVLSSGSFMTTKPYLVDLNGSLYTLNIYSGYGNGGVGDYMWVMDGVNNASAINVQQYKLTSSPFAMALENGGSYSFRFYNAQCAFVSATNYSIWSNPININLPVNTTVPTLKTANAIASCYKTPISANVMAITCTGMDTMSLVTNWNVQLYNVSSIMGWTQFNSINVSSSSFSQTYPSLSNVSALQVRVIDSGPGFTQAATFNFNQGTVGGGISIAGRGFICIVFLLVGLGMGVAGASTGAVEAIHAPSTTCIIEAFMVALMWLTGISNFIPFSIQVVMIIALIFIGIQAHRHESGG